MSYIPFSIKNAFYDKMVLWVFIFMLRYAIMLNSNTWRSNNPNKTRPFEEGSFFWCGF